MCNYSVTTAAWATLCNYMGQRMGNMGVTTAVWRRALLWKTPKESVKDVGRQPSTLQANNSSTLQPFKLSHRKAAIPTTMSSIRLSIK